MFLPFSPSPPNGIYYGTDTLNTYIKLKLFKKCIKIELLNKYIKIELVNKYIEIKVVLNINFYSFSIVRPNNNENVEWIVGIEAWESLITESSL